MATQKGLTSVLIAKLLHKRLKVVAQARGGTLQEFIAVEMERIASNEEARQRAASNG